MILTNHIAATDHMKKHITISSSWDRVNDRSTDNSIYRIARECR